MIGWIVLTSLVGVLPSRKDRHATPTKAAQSFGRPATAKTFTKHLKRWKSKKSII
jgi:hypothetical protein